MSGSTSTQIPTVFASAASLEAQPSDTGDRDQNEWNAHLQSKYGNYRTLVARAVDVFGDELKASRWLSLPNADLNGETPLETARKDDYKIDKIDPILIRIEHGVYW